MSAPSATEIQQFMPGKHEQSPLARHLTYLRSQRMLAERTLAMYGEAFDRLNSLLPADLDLLAVKPHHVRGWVARLHAQGLGPRSIAIHLAAWRGLYKWLAREGLVSVNPVEGISAPKAPKPLPKALGVDQAMALADTAREAPAVKVDDLRGETVLTPSYLKRVAGRSTEDALLALRVDRWDETALLTDKKVRFQLQVALVASDGEVLWSGGFGGEVKAGGMGAAPRDRELMSRSCAELVASELLANLPQRKP